MPPIVQAAPGGSSYAYLETFTYGGLGIRLLYEEMEDLGTCGHR